MSPPAPSLDDEGTCCDDEECKALVWWIVTFLSLFQTLHFLPDRAIYWLIKFIYTVFKFCGRYSPKLSLIADALPRSLHLKNKYLKGLNFGLSEECIVKYVVCPSCYSLYCYEDCVQRTGSQQVSRKCQQILQQSSSKTCNPPLLKEVITFSGKTKLYSHKVYCYFSVIKALQVLLARPGFVDLCESTRTVIQQEGRRQIFHVFDGKVWQRFL